MTKTAARLRAIVDEMSGMFYERTQVIRALMITILARQHSLLLGPPGAAKSELARELTGRITDGNYWEILLSKFTTPPQIFGPVDVAALTTSGKYRQVFEGHATEAHIAFVDEIFKCGDAALNSMLSYFNERKYHPEAGGAPVECNLISAITASNELAQSDTLDALFDRLLVRIEVSYIQDPANFAAYLGSAVTNGSPAARTEIPLDDLRDAIETDVPAVTVPDGIIEAICTLRHQLRRKELVASDRRWRQAIRLLQASAYLDGRDQVTPEDLIILSSILWESIAQRTTVEREVLTLVNPDAREALELLDGLNEVAEQLDAMAGQAEEKLNKWGLEANSKLKTVSRRLDAMHAEAQKAGRSTVTLDPIIVRCREVKDRIVSDALGI